MRLTVVGCGDAFGTGGRLNTCFHVAAAGSEALIDCGATALIGMQRYGLDPGRLSAIFITHLHGDHFAGLVWWLIHARYISQRTMPLLVAGPESLAERFARTAEALFPGSTEGHRAFQMQFIEYRDRIPLRVGPWTVTPFEVSHPSGAPPYALRVEAEGRTVAFTGDTEWVESLIPAAAGADLMISECFGFEEPARYHLTWQEIKAKLGVLQAKQFLLSHLGPAPLANLSAIEAPNVRVAEDGMVLDV